MKSQIVTALFIVAYFAITAQAGERPRVYCGRVLAEQMAMLCNYEEKRSGRNEVDYDGFNQVGWYGPKAYHAFSGLRGKRGIIEECCFQPCSIPTLLTYC